ncbi:hypothetical protein XaC1_175 [Xanthomonas phage XaC1]|nr:hypothetical protein XaC1_175 [Xanthomonas phage XaC1]
MAKEVKDEVQSLRKDKLSKAEQLSELKELRRKGVLSRQLFRLLTWDKGLQGSTKGSPEITTYSFDKDNEVGKVVVSKVGLWKRI